MKSEFYSDNFYQIPVIAFNNITGKGEYKRVNILGKSFADSVKRARFVTNYQQFEHFVSNYRYLKIALMQYYPLLHGHEISRCHAEACLRVFSKDNRVDDNMDLMILTEARKVVQHYMQNKRQQ